MYSVDIELSESEIEQYRTIGLSFIRDFARTIQYQPSQYSSRHVQGFSSRPEVGAAVSRWQESNVGKP